MLDDEFASSSFFSSSQAAYTAFPAFQRVVQVAHQESVYLCV